MAPHSLIVKNKEADDFFQAYKDLKADIDWLKAVVKVATGLEVTFVSETAIRKFLSLTSDKDEWEVECELSSHTLITLAPRGQGGHTMVSDQTIVAFLTRFGKVVQGRRLVYRDFPTVENGVRQYRVEIRSNTTVPSVVSFGRTSFFVSYRGQTKTCLRCGSKEHLARECSIIRCHKCGEEGHHIKECPNEVLCSICGANGHSYRKCPKSYSGALRLTSQFSNINVDAEPGASDNIARSKDLTDKAVATREAAVGAANSGKKVENTDNKGSEESSGFLQSKSEQMQEQKSIETIDSHSKVEVGPLTNPKTEKALSHKTANPVQKQPSKIAETGAKESMDSNSQIIQNSPETEATDTQCLSAIREAESRNVRSLGSSQSSDNLFSQDLFTSQVNFQLHVPPPPWAVKRSNPTSSENDSDETAEHSKTDWKAKKKQARRPPKSGSESE